ncbi:hypothetical protein AB0B85_13750 [Micromonospora sp. NPDC049044]|uniref:hypothetical protein n=1 Tax=Micromonospora sp. NPDC049044 TaxID=3154827 RepID=UPI0033D852D5
MPSLNGLEVWLIGTPTELHAATDALAEAGHVVQRGTRHTLTGTDTGRYRLYLRLSVAAGRQRPTGGTLIDLTAARAARRSA